MSGCSKSEHARGALTNLETLNLYKNKIGDAGCTALAEACASAREG